MSFEKHVQAESVVPVYELHQHTVRDLLVTRLADGTYVVGRHQGNGTYRIEKTYSKDSRALAVALANDVDSIEGINR